MTGMSEAQLKRIRDAQKQFGAPPPARCVPTAVDVEPDEPDTDLEVGDT